MNETILPVDFKAAGMITDDELSRACVHRLPDGVRAEPESVEEKIKEAVEVCDTEDAAKCAEAWDEVEEVSAAAADKREKEKANQDPLEKYCESAPDADECRVYED